MFAWLPRSAIVALVASLLVACAPITADSVQRAAESSAALPGGTVPPPGGTVPLPTETATVAPSPTPSPTPDDSATATVLTSSLRVRAEPTVNSAEVGKILSGESYAVTARSSDGMWLEVALPQFDIGSGWVSVDLVTMRGDITDLPIVKIPTPPPPTATFTPAPATAIPTVELPTATPEGGAPITETVESAEPTLEPAVEPTLEPTVEASALVTESTNLTESSTLTETATETPTPAPTAEGIAAPAAGLATITAEWRVRIRAEPNTEAPIVGFGYRGETFPVLEISADGTWVRLGGSSDTPENTEGGWVSAQYLAIGQ
jgi:uncharacterized protein YraI